jgi:hypothetical protein
LSDVGGTDEEDTGSIFNCMDYKIMLVYASFLFSFLFTFGAANNKFILSIGAVDLLE